MLAGKLILFGRTFLDDDYRLADHSFRRETCDLAWYAILHDWLVVRAILSFELLTRRYFRFGAGPCAEFWFHSHAVHKPPPYGSDCGFRTWSPR